MSAGNFGVQTRHGTNDSIVQYQTENTNRARVSSWAIFVGLIDSFIDLRIEGREGERSPLSQEYKSVSYVFPFFSSFFSPNYFSSLTYKLLPFTNKKEDIFVLDSKTKKKERERERER